MVAQNIAFWLIAVIMVFAALKVVIVKNVVHAALYLVVVLAGVAALFLLLGAEFVDRQNVGVRQGGGGFGLALEARQASGVGGDALR